MPLAWWSDVDYVFCWLLFGTGFKGVAIMYLSGGILQILWMTFSIILHEKAGNNCNYS